MKIRIVVLAMLLGGCATQHITLPAMGESKADGTVELGYKNNRFLKYEIDQEKSKTIALARCAAWGYNDAIMFDNPKTGVCESYSYGSCTVSDIIFTYQCANK